jgi:hypothetical protein
LVVVVINCDVRSVIMFHNARAIGTVMRVSLVVMLVNCDVGRVIMLHNARAVCSIM